MRYLLLLLSLAGFAQPFPFYAAREAPAPLVLDTFSGATAAYSVRKLRNSATLCMRIRRNGDNAEQDIGFVNGTVDTASAEAFCAGPVAGYLVRWYDQTGNGNYLWQTNITLQPSVVTSSAVFFTDGGKPAVDFGTGADFIRMTLTTPLSGSQPWSVSSVWRRSNDNVAMALLLSLGATPEILTTGNTPLYVASSAAYSTYNIAADVKDVMSFFAKASVQDCWRNNAQLTPATSNIALAGNANFDTLGADTATFSHVGNMQEIIYWPSDKSANVLAIHTNLNTYYGVY